MRKMTTTQIAWVSAPDMSCSVTGTSAPVPPCSPAASTPWVSAAKAQPPRPSSNIVIHRDLIARIIEFLAARQRRSGRLRARGIGLLAELVHHERQQADDQREEGEPFDKGGRDDHRGLDSARRFRLPGHTFER